MVTLANELHSAKAKLPIWVTESGMISLDNEVHNQKVLCPTCVTEWGMVTLANLLHWWNAYAVPLKLSHCMEQFERQNSVTCSYKGELAQFRHEIDLRSFFTVQIMTRPPASRSPRTRLRACHRRVPSWPIEGGAGGWNPLAGATWLKDWFQVGEEKPLQDLE